ncbi:hypothetical protein K469DRAFT_586050 [Zopfia rhizophila CBS 207.26]|uniref:Uncharacterized protein n=1 Tax=Zopfia rhizophila CBS 207.26 TaxID=1314779 RepID=A0A6A6DY98_9PEZI|nr:hypothetical protein K469DRAFT_586050 [Zopfia rhizophila CBS 207.26]
MPPVQEAPSKEARYNDLIVQSYKVPEGFNLFAVFSLWILLAGFVVFPATFPSIQNSSSLGSSTPGKVVQHAVQNVPLLVFAIICFVLGAVGICWLWRKRRREYIWLMDKLFLPGCLNSLAGFITTLVNVKFARNGHWSKPALATSVATGACVLILATLYGVYKLVVVPRHIEIPEIPEKKDVPSDKSTV